MASKKVFALLNLKRGLIYLSVLLSILFVIYIIISFQFTIPCLYGTDGYYHIKIPCFIKQYGPVYNFKWAQFSTFSKGFSDKEILLHIFTIPFTFISSDFHTNAKIAIIAFSMLFFASYLFILNKYTYKLLHPIALISLALSTNFIIYINYLRPKTLAVTIILILLYLLIEKKWIWVFLLCIIYTLTHISYPLVLILSLGIETLRYLYKKEFYIRNFLYSLLGVSIGTILHPNFPYNFVSLYLNAILVPWNTALGKLSLNYGAEWNPMNTKAVILTFFILFTGILFSFLILITRNVKLKFHTIAFFFVFCVFLVLSMFSSCYWYFTYPIGLLFLSMFFTDYLKYKNFYIRTAFLFMTGLILIFQAYLIIRDNNFSQIILKNLVRNSHYERMGNWMNKNIPPGELIYHTCWSDSPYFMCLNPKDYYIAMLDPIYMYHFSEEVYNYYHHLSMGRTKDPYSVLKNSFKANYGYTTKSYGLYKQIKKDDRFKILFEDQYGAIFQLMD